MKRIDALAAIDEVWQDRPLVVTCGATSRELAHHRRRPSHLYLLDAMGASAAVGVGLALGGATPVAAIEGDGSLLMGLSVLASIGHHRPAGFTLILLDNHEHASAARRPTQAVDVDLAAVVRSLSIPTTTVETTDTLRDAVLKSLHADGPTCVAARIEGGNQAGTPWLLEDPVLLSAEFRGALEPTTAT